MATKTKTGVVADGTSATAEPAAPASSTSRRGAVSYLTVEERRARGRALREQTPRTSHANWVEPPNRPDPIALLEAQATTRLQDLIQLRYARMRVSHFA